MKDDKVYFLELNCRRRMAETKGTGGCPCDGKLRRMGLPFSFLSSLGICVCAIRLGLRRLENGRPQDGCPRDGWPWDGCSRDGWQRRKAEADAPEMESWEGWALRLHVFPSGEYPSVPFVLAFAVSKTFVSLWKAETEETDVPETEGVLLMFFCNIVENLRGSSAYCESLCSTLLTKIPFICLFSRITIPNISTQRRNK